jgi:hypothetical protein
MQLTTSFFCDEWLLSTLDVQSILAELIRPGTFSAIVAVDPTMFPEAMDIHTPFPDNPLGQSTLRRRDTWKDRYALGRMGLCWGLTVRLGLDWFASYKEYSYSCVSICLCRYKIGPRQRPNSSKNPSFKLGIKKRWICILYEHGLFIISSEDLEDVAILGQKVILTQFWFLGLVRNTAWLKMLRRMVRLK